MRRPSGRLALRIVQIIALMILPIALVAAWLFCLAGDARSALFAALIAVAMLGVFAGLDLLDASKRYHR